MQFVSSISITIIALTVFAGVQGEYKKLEWTDFGSTGITIKEASITPMPIFNPGEAFLTFIADLKRPINTIRTKLDIERSVSGIKLPVKCYKVNGLEVGSCDYKDLCLVLKALLPSFNPQQCVPSVAQFGIDCTCPFNIPIQQLRIMAEKLTLPDAQATAANFMATGDFKIKLDAFDDKGPYASIELRFSVKAAKPSG